MEKLADYRQKIKSDDFHNHSFVTKRSTWSKYAGHTDFKKFYTNFFNTESRTISRKDLFDDKANNFIEKVFTIILWGYPKDMRGNNFKLVLNNIEKIKRLEDWFKNKTNHTEAEFIALRKQFRGTGVGISTLTKLLYFFNITINGYKCVILDRKIINALNNRKYEELSMLHNIVPPNEHKHYFNYIKLIAEIAKEYHLEVDALEMFLYKNKL